LVRVKSAPSRLFLEYFLLPKLRRGLKPGPRILIVGVAEFTCHYFDLFKMHDVTSIDIDRRVAQFGSPTGHISDSVARLSCYCPDNHVDAVIMNGVYGWGLDTYEGMRGAIDAVYSALRPPPGLLIFGWDRWRGRDPLGLDNINLMIRFERTSRLGLRRLTFIEKWRLHIYDILEKGRSVTPCHQVSATLKQAADRPRRADDRPGG
jgi:hypothetical protein